MRRKLLLAGAAVAAAAGIVACLAWAAARPSNRRAWAADQAVLPYAERDGDRLLVRNVRDFRYRSANDFDVRYEDRVYDLRGLETAWFGVVPFDAGWRGPAHTFVSFGFEDGRYLAVSVEVRKEVGETYSPLRGLFRKYELMYVVGDERDVIGLRTHHRRDPVFLYPIRAPRERIVGMLERMLARAGEQRDRPEFYHTLTNNCTSNLVRHVNELVPGRVPFSFRVLLPAYSDRLAYDLGLIDTDLPFDAARERFRIDERARRIPVTEDFSRLIRTP